MSEKSDEKDGKHGGISELDTAQETGPATAGNSPPSIACFSSREEGQGLAEYSLILAFVFAACIIAVGAVGLAIAGQLPAITAAFP